MLIQSVGDPHCAKVPPFWLDLVQRSTDSKLLETYFLAKTLRTLLVSLTLACHIDKKQISSVAKSSANRRGCSKKWACMVAKVSCAYIIRTLSRNPVFAPALTTVLQVSDSFHSSSTCWKNTQNFIHLLHNCSLAGTLQSRLLMMAAL